MARKKVIFVSMNKANGNGLRVELESEGSVGFLRFSRLYTPARDGPPVAASDYVLGLADFNEIALAMGYEAKHS